MTTGKDAGESLIEQAFVRTERDGEREGHFILMRNDIRDAHPMTSTSAGTNCAVAKPACTLIVP